MIHVSDLSKSYGDVQALNRVTFDVAENEIVGLLGPNGAGKTTILKILTGYLQQDEGMVSVSETDVLTNPHVAQSKIGYLPENAPLYPELSVQSYLMMIAELREIPTENVIEYISQAVQAVGLEEYLTRPIGELSKGYRQRVGLAQAILHKPKLLILDEPTVGLDPTQIVQIRHLIKRLAENSTVLFSTHILPEVEALCDRAIILIAGEIKTDALLSDLANSNLVLLSLDKTIDEPNEIASILEEISGVLSLSKFIDPNGYLTFKIESEIGPDLSPKIFEVASGNNWPVREIKNDTRTLENVFNELALSE